MRLLSGKHVTVKMLGAEWRHRMVDVCGVGVFRRKDERLVYITHLDSDHLPLKEHVLGANMRFFTASKFVKKLEVFYGGAFDVYEYSDVLMLRHTTINSKRRIVERETCAFFVGEAMIIPECDDPDELIREYRPRVAFIFVAQQSHQHPVGFNNHRRDVFILHNKIWKPYAPNVIPKIVFASTGEDRRLFKSYIAGGV